MAILKVARMGHPVLRTKARAVPVSEITSPGVQRLINDMIETMHEYAGIGLAAPQVHISGRLFVAGIRVGQEKPNDDKPDESADAEPLVVINPELTLIGSTAEFEEAWEGCLSIPDVRGLVPRATEVRVKGYDRHGHPLAFSVKGLPARVVQHETDHLDGILFMDRMSSLDSLTFMDEYHRFWSKDEDA